MTNISEINGDKMSEPIKLNNWPVLDKEELKNYYNEKTPQYAGFSELNFVGINFL